MKKYNWAVIGCGSIANEMAQAMTAESREIYSVYSRTYEKTKVFAEKYGVKKICKSADEIFTDDNVDIVYIATPHNTHIDYIISALENGKHVLCEKAITLNSQELSRAVNLANEKGLILAEAMTSYHMPMYSELSKIISQGKLGKLNVMQVALGSAKEYDMTNRFFNPKLAGGAMLDLGVYALSFMRFFMTENPQSISSFVKKAPTGVDEQSVIILENTKNEMATILLSLDSKMPKRGTVSFENGYIEIYEYPRSAQAVITYTADGSREIVENGDTKKALVYEVCDMERAVSGEKNNMHLDYTQDVMQIMTKLRRDWNIIYPEEM
ncbi:MAG: Gfo/Idh/MocA family oxidoreductase [Clostridiales bacterium]|nr:Gfo/Idh/MocA family oxidoreductase [Clostridiales bacterium]